MKSFETSLYELKPFVLLSWISLPTVMFGGYSLMNLMDTLTPHQVHFFRLGHAHAGVLLVLSLVFYHYLALTHYAKRIKMMICGVFAAGVVFQSGGFFWHAFLDKPGIATGMILTTIGAVLLVSAVSALVIGIARGFTASS